MTTQTQISQFVRVPAMFLQAGFPLKIALYQYTPITKGLRVLHRRGEVLDLASFCEVNRPSLNATVVVLKQDLEKILKESLDHLEEIDQLAG